MNNSPIRILHVITGMGSGGAEMMIMNWYRNIDRSKVQFDFLLRSTENIYTEEIEALGGRVYYTAEYPRHYFKNKRETKRFFKEHGSEYAAIHVHCNALLYVNVFKIAQKSGIKVRVIHSHNTHAKNKIFGLAHKFNKGRVRKIATHLFACSKEAGEWAFSPKGGYRVVNNGIDTEKHRYDPEARESIREELGLKDKFVIGHVGRFLPSKNHEFLIEVFDRLQREKENAVLLLIGEGPLQDEVKEAVCEKGLEDKVVFMGVRKDVNKLYSAFDCFVLPSKHEGLAVVLVESQASGVNCITSTAVTREAAITERISFLPIDDHAQWVKAIAEAPQMDRADAWRAVEERGYGAKASAEELQTFYIKNS